MRGNAQLNPSPDTYNSPDVTNVDRIDEGVIITFANGVTAVYGSEFLFRSLDRAQELEQAEESSTIEIA